MDVLNSLLLSLLTPMVLAFLLGVAASLVKSDLKIPPEIYTAMTIYLLFAIGLKGGAKLDGVTFAEFWRPLTAALFLSLAIPVWCYAIMRKFGKLDGVNSAALAAHYGSVSAVTFGEAVAFLQFAKVPYEPYVAALLAVMEVPAIILAIFLVGKATIASGGGDMKKVLRELLTSKSIVLLMGGMAIGLLAGKEGTAQVAPLFEDPFRGVLTLFLLEIGLVTGRWYQFVVENIGTKWTLWVDGKETLSLNLKRSDVEKESVNFIGFGPFLLDDILIEELPR